MAVRAKICGLVRPADAELAVRGGASFLGAVFAESPRQVGAAQARELAAAGAPLPLLGVFVDTSPDEILRLRDRGRLAGAQLHGAYDAGVRERLQREGMLVWAVARLGAAADLELLPALAPAADVLLVEPRVAGAHGGTGEVLPDELAAELRSRVGPGRLALAGGLTPETVAARIALVRPDIVDVSSGVEGRPGVKDEGRLRHFLEVVADADARA